MGNNDKKTERQPGPYDETTTRTFEVAPIKITITETVKSSHVPPPEGGCGCGGGLGLADIMNMAQQAAASVTTPPIVEQPGDPNAPQH